MWVTVDGVKTITGYDVDEGVIERAQFIIESYVGKTEIEIVDGWDTLLLERATAYQAAYMAEDPIKVFEQVAVVQTAQFGQSLTLRNDGVTPWVAPLAVLACQRLTWKRARGVKFGSLFHRAPVELEWETS